LDEAEIISVIKDLTDATNNKLSEEQTKSMTDFFDKFEFSDGVVWINKETLNFHRLSGLLKLPNRKNNPSALKFNVVFSKFNVPVQLDVPAQSKSIEEIIANFFSMGMQNTELNTSIKLNSNVNDSLIGADKTSVNDSDNDGLSDSLEDIYGTLPNNPDSDKDGYTDGEEVKNGYSPTGPGKLQQ